jgi:flagellar motor switch protein FliN/FliY
MSTSPERNGLDISLEEFRKIGEIPLILSAELDRRTTSVRELLGLNVGSLLLLNRPTGENIDLYVGEVLLASAEILVVDGTLAVRIADLRDKGAGIRTSNVHSDHGHDALP